ncbi:MAG: Smr/MutS family protein [Pseudolabrys sp.]
MDRKAGRRRGLTRDDRTLWSDFTKSIDPLRERPSAAASEDSDDDRESAAPPSRKIAPAAATASPPAPRNAPPLEKLDRRMKKRVASGRAAIDARLDLHGHTQSEAHSELLRFLNRAAQREQRLVLVITGKSGVLRRQVPLWLALPEFRAHVIGFETAHVGHGGDGALYVRLRRTKNT